MRLHQLQRQRHHYLVAGRLCHQGRRLTFNSGRTVVGDGVTFYLADSGATLTFNGNVQASLKAPASGTYADILFYEPNGLAQTPLVINGTTGSSFQGLMYLPSRNVTVNSVSNAAMNGVTMVFNSLILNQINWKIESSKKSMSTGGVSDGNISLVR